MRQATNGEGTGDPQPNLPAVVRARVPRPFPTLPRHPTALPDSAISIRGLPKSYGDHEAVRGIDLEVQPGEIFAFLGPNGAGKTTTVEILEGYRQRSAGEVTVLGEDPQRAGRAWRERIGI